MRLLLGVPAATLVLFLLWRWVQGRHGDGHDYGRTATVGLWLYSGGLLVGLGLLFPSVIDPNLVRPLALLLSALGGVCVLGGAWVSLCDPPFEPTSRSEPDPGRPPEVEATARQAATDCPLCLAPLEDGAGELLPCPRCATAYHRACVAELGDRCVAFGCNTRLA